MKLYYHPHEKGNFGDDLNSWIWDELIPGWRDWDDSVTLIGVGTLLNEKRLKRFRDSRLLVLGTGAGYGPAPAIPLPAQWDIRAVRGPQSARILGLPPKHSMIDPAVMLSEMDEFKSVKKSGATLFVPHLRSAGRHDWGSICDQAGVRFVSPRWDPKQVISELASASLVLAESMHAAIIADTFRVPWIPVRLARKLNVEKWHDWADSLAITTTIPSAEFGFGAFLPPIAFRSSSMAGETQGDDGSATEATPRALASSGTKASRTRTRPSLSIGSFVRLVERRILPYQIRQASRYRAYLSDESVLSRKKQQYLEMLATVRADYGT